MPVAVALDNRQLATGNSARDKLRSDVLTPGQKLGVYQLIDRLGAGGMGEVWKAEDPRLGRTVAIKILSPKIAADHESILRLQREARTAAQLYHPNIATIHSIEEDNGQLFIVMEYVPGESLTKLIHGRKLTEIDICRIGKGVAEALAEAHEKGIVHRDIKPDNIIVNGQRVKVLDFGVAKRVGFESTVSGDTPTDFVTQQGMIVGTVFYMSPEQALGKPLDARSDIFSLGVVLYEAITGRQPFGGETITETITQIVRDEPPPLARLNPAISPGFTAIIEKCLRKKREERYASAAELSAALDHQLARASTEMFTAPTMVKPIPVAAPPTLVEPQPRKSRGWVWGVVIAAVLLIALAAAWARQKQVPKPVVAATTTTAAPAPAPSQSAVNVTAPPPVIEEQHPTSPPMPVTETHAPPQAPPPPPVLDARTHFHLGEEAVINHDFGTGTRELQMALDRGADLTDRERRLAELCLAIAADERLRAGELGREFHRIYGPDPEFERIKESYAEEHPKAGHHPVFPRRRFKRP